MLIIFVCSTVMPVCVYSIARTGIERSKVLTLLSLSIKVFEFEFSLSLALSVNVSFASVRFNKIRL